MKLLYGCEECGNIYETSCPIEETEKRYGEKVYCYGCGGKLKRIRGA